MSLSRPAARTHKPGGQKPRRRVFATLCALFATSLVAVLSLTAVGGSATSSAAPTPKAPTVRASLGSSTVTLPGCTDVSHKGALHVSGKLLLNAADKGFAYYGITVYGGLEQGGSNKVWQQGQKAAMAQIEAAPWWHANTVRIQLNEADVFNKGIVNDGVNTAYLKAVCQQVSQIRKQGEEVVISDQTEWPEWSEGLPTARSVSFWQVIGKIYRNQQGVSLDLYNEPRLMTPPSGFKGNVANWRWQMWHNGGKADGQTFVGMQKLYDDVRATDPDNLIWIEGPYYDDTLGMANQYPIKGTGIVWSLHHPVLTNTSDWTKYFGFLAASYPMVDGEWGQYAGNKPECRAGAQKTVPTFLKYLRSKNIGMLGWSLQPGAMLADPHHYQPSNTWQSRDATSASQLRTPSRMYSNYSCSQKDIGEGAGEMLLNYFKAYSHLPSS